MNHAKQIFNNFIEYFSYLKYIFFLKYCTKLQVNIEQSEEFCAQ